jgi:hypothetical protein
MITRISSGSSPAGAVFYNEQKVGKGEAKRLTIRNFEGVNLPVHQLTATIVAEKLVNRADLNDRIKKPTFHVSLALAKGEQVPANDMIAIADQYMQGMGYGRQPYAVYQHHDTEHPHIHIVSVRVDQNAKKIPDSYERERSNKLRQQIEKEFGLEVAEKAQLKQDRQQLTPVEYGKGDLKADLSAVVQGILKDFTFSSFSQFNQLLKIYNVQATEIPLDNQKPGLKYSAIDSNGAQAGAALKASSLSYRPTYERIERRIGAGKKIKGDRIGPLRKAADGHLAQSNSWNEFQERLSKMGVEVLPHLGKDGNLFGISIIDTRQRTIYTGSELGKAFTAGSLKERLGEIYQSPTLREVQAEKARVDSPGPHSHQTQNQSKEAGLEHQVKPEEATTPHIDLMRQLLYALGEDEPANDSEQDLKRMLKKSRKPRLS